MTQDRAKIHILTPDRAFEYGALQASKELMIDGQYSIVYDADGKFEGIDMPYMVNAGTLDILENDKFLSELNVEDAYYFGAMAARRVYQLLALTGEVECDDDVAKWEENLNGVKMVEKDGFRFDCSLLDAIGFAYHFAVNQLGIYPLLFEGFEEEIKEQARKFDKLDTGFIS